MDFHLLSFSGLAAMALGGGFLAVTVRNLMHAGLSLALSLIGVAGLFILMDADFLGVAQLMVYVGGVLVVVVFAVMLVQGIADKSLPAANEQKGWGAIAALAFLGLAASVFVKDIYSYIPRADDASQVLVGQPTSKQIGAELMTTHLLPFEVASVLLLVAVVGAILLTRQEGEEA